MAELKPLASIQGTQVQEKKEAEKSVIEQPTEKVEISNDLLKKINGELCFELQFGSKTLVVSESKCSQLIPEFKKMSVEQKETFLMQAAIFGANPFSLPPEIYPVPFTSNNTTTYAPVISAKKYVEKGMENPKFDGMKSGVVVEKADGSFDFRKGQIFGKTEKLSGGWCEIFIKGMREPIFRSVNLNEVMNFKNDGTPNKFWKEKPALMVEKVAQKQAMEIAMQMPKTYIEEELPIIDINHEDLSQQKAISASNDEFFNK